MKGLLSQALANALAAENHIKALSGLPPAAKKIQSASVSLITRMIPKIGQLQSAVSSFTKTATRQLNQAEKKVGGTGPLSEVKTLMLQVQKEASSLQAIVDGVATEIIAEANSVFAYSKQLAGIESKLNLERIGLQSKLRSDMSQLASAKKTYDWLLAFSWLGGVVGLAAALIAYTTWQKTVSGTQRAMSAMIAKITALARMVVTIKQLEADFHDLSTKISNVKNSIDFLAGDIKGVLQDVEKENVARTTIALYIKAALTEVATVGTDAS